MRAGADLPETLDRRGVAGARRERTPEEVLVERERAGVRVAMVEVDVRGLQVGGREDDALADRRLEVRHVARDPRLDPVGVTLAQLLGPGSIAGVELPGRIAPHVPVQLL